MTVVWRPRCWWVGLLLLSPSCTEPQSMPSIKGCSQGFQIRPAGPCCGGNLGAFQRRYCVSWSCGCTVDATQVL